MTARLQCLISANSISWRVYCHLIPGASRCPLYVCICWHPLLTMDPKRLGSFRAYDRKFQDSAVIRYLSFVEAHRAHSASRVNLGKSRDLPRMIDSFEAGGIWTIDFQNYVLASPKEFSTLSTFVCSKFAISPNSLKSWLTSLEDLSLCLLNSRNAKFGRLAFEFRWRKIKCLLISVHASGYLFTLSLKTKVFLVILRLTLRSLENAQSSKWTHELVLKYRIQLDS